MMQEKGVKIMPKVGDKSFPYTQEGMAQAETEAEITGEEVIPTYDAGGRTERIQGYGDEKSGTPSNLVANGEMTDEEVVKYINPQATSEEGGKVPEYKTGGKIVKNGVGTENERISKPTERLYSTNPTTKRASRSRPTTQEEFLTAAKKRSRGFKKGGKVKKEQKKKKEEGIINNND
jgi:hypothetical protein